MKLQEEGLWVMQRGGEPRRDLVCSSVCEQGDGINFRDYRFRVAVRPSSVPTEGISILTGETWRDSYQTQPLNV